ncbi:MAG: hypothetical protein KA069_01290 [Candidatus Saccharimonas sp.]|nr:hypothetical protein [Candidatus Saccharimonas sp.]
MSARRPGGKGHGSKKKGHHSSARGHQKKNRKKNSRVKRDKNKNRVVTAAPSIAA